MSAIFLLNKNNYHILIHRTALKWICSRCLHNFCVTQLYIPQNCRLLTLESNSPHFCVLKILHTVVLRWKHTKGPVTSREKITMSGKCNRDMLQWHVLVSACATQIKVAATTSQLHLPAHVVFLSCCMLLWFAFCGFVPLNAEKSVATIL